MRTAVSVFRPHWVTLLAQAMAWLLGAAALFSISQMAAASEAMSPAADVAFWGGVVSLGLVGLAVVVAFVRWRFCELLVHTDRLVYRVGFVRRRVVTVPLREIASSDVHQGLLARLWGYGDLVVDNRGASLLRVCNVGDVMEASEMMRLRRDALASEVM